MSYIKIHSQIRNHWVSDDLRYYFAWTQLVLSVNVFPKNVSTKKNGLVWVESGSTITSIPKLEIITRLKKTALNNFLEKCVQDDMIILKQDEKGTSIEIANYQHYNPQKDDEQTKDKPKTNQKPDTLNEGMKKGSKEVIKKVPKKKISFNYEDGEFSGISDLIYNKWLEAYPNLDVDGELKRSSAWLLSNTSKTYSDYGGFLSNWLGNSKGNNPTSTDSYEIENEKILVEMKAEREKRYNCE